MDQIRNKMKTQNCDKDWRKNYIGTFIDLAQAYDSVIR